MEERPQREPAEDDQRGERERRRNEPVDQRRAYAALAAAHEGPCHDEQRRDGESWKISTEKLARPTGAPSRLPSMRTGITIAVEDMLERRRRSPQAPASAQATRRPPRAHRGDGDLQKTEPEHEPAHALKALEGQLEPHGEQKRHDPEGGDFVD